MSSLLSHTTPCSIRVIEVQYMVLQPVRSIARTSTILFGCALLLDGGLAGFCFGTALQDAQASGPPPSVAVQRIRDVGAFGSSRLVSAQLRVTNTSRDALSNITFTANGSAGPWKVVTQSTRRLAGDQAKTIQVMYEVPDSEAASTGTIRVQGTRASGGYTPWAETSVPATTSLSL